MGAAAVSVNDGTSAPRLADRAPSGNDIGRSLITASHAGLYCFFPRVIKRHECSAGVDVVAVVWTQRRWLMTNRCSLGERPQTLPAPLGIHASALHCLTVNLVSSGPTLVPPSQRDSRCRPRAQYQMETMSFMTTDVRKSAGKGTGFLGH